MSATATGRKEAEPSTTHELSTPPSTTTTTVSAATVKSTGIGEIVIPGRSATMPGTLMSPQQFSSSASNPPPRDEGKPRAKAAGSIGLTKEQMQEALVYLIQVSF